MIKIYEDKLNEVVTETVYKIMADKKEKEILSLDNQIKNIENDIKSLQNQLDKDEDKINDIKTILNKFLNSSVIEQDLIHQIITRIEVGDDNEIEVFFAISELKSISE